MINIIVWDDMEDMKCYVGDNTTFSNCTQEECEWLVNFCVKRRKPISIEILPEGEADG